MAVSDLDQSHAAPKSKCFFFIDQIVVIVDIYMAASCLPFVCPSNHIRLLSLELFGIPLNIAVSQRKGVSR